MTAMEVDCVYVLLLFAISLSLDAVAVGFSYGMKKIKIPIPSLVMLFVISALMGAAGTFFGTAVSALLCADAAKWISFLLLLGLGLWMIYDSFRDAKEKGQRKELKEEKSFEFMVKSMGLSVKIIKHPIDCDFDKSSTIDLWEAAYLAFLLSIDVICSCASLAVSGNSSYIIPVLVGVFQTAFLCGGNLVGKYFSNVRFLSAKVIQLLPGIILVCVALLRFFG